MTKITYIPGEIANAAIDEHGNRKPVTRTQHIFDDAKGKSQAEVNADISENIAEIKGGSTDSIATLNQKIATEKGRAQGAEQGLNNRLSTVEELAEISVSGGEAQIATGSDFDNPDATKRAKVPTVGAILDGLNDGVYDVSKRNPTGGPNSDGKFTLAYILANANTLIPTSWRHGGMEICFIQSSDNKYVQYRYMGIDATTAATFTNTANWQDISSTIKNKYLKVASGAQNNIIEIYLTGLDSSKQYFANQFRQYVNSQSDPVNRLDIWEVGGNERLAFVLGTPSNGVVPVVEDNNSGISGYAILNLSAEDSTDKNCVFNTGVISNIEESSSIRLYLLDAERRINTNELNIQEVQSDVAYNNTFVPTPYRTDNAYVLNGVYTQHNSQSSKIFRVKKGTIFNFLFGNNVTLRYGEFNNIPSIGDTTETYGSSVLSPFQYTVSKDCWIVISHGKNNDVSIKTVGKIDTMPIKDSVNPIMSKGVFDAFKDSSKGYTSILRFKGETDGGYHFCSELILIPAGTFVRNLGNVSINLYHVDDIDSNDKITLEAGAYIITPFDIVRIRDKGIVGQYDVIAYLDRDSIYNDDELSIKDSLNDFKSKIGTVDTVIDMTSGYYKLGLLDIDDTVDNTVYSNPSYKCAKVSCKDGDVFALYISAGSSGGLYVFADESNKVLAKGSGLDFNGYVTAPANAAWLFVNNNNFIKIPSSKKGNGIIPKIERNVTKLNHFSRKGSLGASQTMMSAINYTRKNISLCAKIKFTALDSITIGLGKVTYRGMWFEIDATNVKVYWDESGSVLVNTYTHGLTLSDELLFNFDRYTTDGIIRLTCKGMTFTQQLTGLGFHGGGQGFVTNNGASSITFELSIIPRDVLKPLYLIGDSYLSFDSDARWLYYMLQWDYKNWFSDSLPGANSTTMLAAFKNDILLGSPKFAIWCLGMNDTADVDSSTPDSVWLSNVQEFLDICKANVVTPILTTIPSVPNKLHEGKNSFVRNVGCRYIDFANAVNAQANGTWGEGYLSSDNIHPTQKGAIMLANQVLLDLPEIMNT